MNEAYNTNRIWEYSRTGEPAKEASVRRETPFHFDVSSGSPTSVCYPASHQEVRDGSVTEESAYPTP